MPLQPLPATPVSGGGGGGSSRTKQRKRKGVFRKYDLSWTCCLCGETSMWKSEECCACEFPRCLRCKVSKVRRPIDHKTTPAPRFSSESSLDPLAINAPDKGSTAVSSPSRGLDVNKRGDSAGSQKGGESSAGRIAGLPAAFLQTPNPPRAETNPRRDQRDLETPGTSAFIAEPSQQHPKDRFAGSGAYLTPHTNALQCIVELCNDIHGRLAQPSDRINWQRFSGFLPELVGIFAMKIGYPGSQANQEVGCFIQQRQSDIVEQLEITFKKTQEDINEVENHMYDANKGMSILEKMSLWDSKPESDSSPAPQISFSQGAQDDELLDSVVLDNYVGVITNSEAYEWLITTLRDILGKCTYVETTEGRCPPESDACQYSLYKTDGQSSTAAFHKSVQLHPHPLLHEEDAPVASAAKSTRYSVFGNCEPDSQKERQAEWNSQHSNTSKPEEDVRSSTRAQSTESPLDSCILSISDSSEEAQSISCVDQTSQLFHDIVNRLLSSFSDQKSIGHQLSPGESPDIANNTTGGTARPSSTSDQQQQCRKRRVEDVNNNETDQGGFRMPPPKRAMPKDDIVLPNPFACPYLKADPVKHGRCCTYTLNRIRDVKQHLHRRHTPERYCQRCLITDFSDEASLQLHVRLDTCQPRDPTLLEGVSNNQRLLLGRKSKSKLSEKEKWFAIWEILFPKPYPRPTSPYLDIELSLEMRLFRAFCDTQGPAILAQSFESDSDWLAANPTEAQRQACLRRATSAGISRLFEQWREASASSSTSSSRSETGGIGQRPQNTTQASSSETTIEESGVALGGQSSLAIPQRGQVAGLSAQSEAVIPNVQAFGTHHDSGHERQSQLSIPGATWHYEVVVPGGGILDSHLDLDNFHFSDYVVDMDVPW